MNATRSLPCIACGQPIRRAGSWGGCRQCAKRAEAHLRATVGTRDPSAWVRACNQTFGSRERFIEAARAA